MTVLAAAILLSQTRAKVDAPTLEFYQDRFVVRTSKDVAFVPIQPRKAEPKLSVSFRRDDDYAVWDERGLTIRHRDRNRTMRMEEAVVSERFFSKDEIRETLRLVETGERQKGATALSGAARYARDAFFLLRWEDSKHRPWTEFLVRVPLEGKNLWPEVVGQFEGRSLGYKPIDDRVFILGEGLAAVTRQDRVWGLSTYDVQKRRFAFHPLGDELLSFMPTSHKTGLYVERTAYGMTQAGQIDVATGERVPVFEAPSNVRFLDVLQPSVVVASSSDAARVHNAETGAETAIPLGSGIGRAGRYVLVWTPADSPKTATLYDPARWKQIATWAAKP